MGHRQQSAKTRQMVTGVTARREQIARDAEGDLDAVAASRMISVARRMACAGASLWELMDRMGHDRQQAAMIYLYGSDARQHEIADTLSKLGS